MGIFKVSCYSSCGSYFGGYLQSVTVIAADKEDATKKVKKWLKKEGRNFIYSEDKWECYEVTNNLDAGVIDWHEDSDY